MHARDMMMPAERKSQITHALLVIVGLVTHDIIQSWQIYTGLDTNHPNAGARYVCSTDDERTDLLYPVPQIGHKKPQSLQGPGKL